MRNIRSLHYGLGQLLALLVNLTIPTMKLTVAQWGLLLQANQAADMQQAVADGANEVLSAYASAAGTAATRNGALRAGLSAKVAPGRAAGTASSR